MAEGPARRDDARPFSWRAAMALAGVAFVAAGACLVLWPHLLSWAVGGALGLLGFALFVSAVAAR